MGDELIGDSTLQNFREKREIGNVPKVVQVIGVETRLNGSQPTLLNLTGLWWGHVINHVNWQSCMPRKVHNEVSAQYLHGWVGVVVGFE